AITGSLNAYGNNNGLYGSTGVTGSNGTNGASNTYFGLAVDTGYKAGANQYIPGDVELGGQITIDNTTVGLVTFNSVSVFDPLPSPSAFGLYINEVSPSGSTIYDYS